MVEWQGPKMGGFRLETRIKPNGCSWEMFEQQVDGGTAKRISNTMGVEVHKGLILHSAQSSLHARNSLGLGRYSSQQRQQRITGLPKVVAQAWPDTQIHSLAVLLGRPGAIPEQLVQKDAQL